MEVIRFVFKLAIAFCWLINTTSSSFSEQFANIREMLAGDTYVKVLTEKTIDSFLDTDRPVFISFTKENCRSCYSFDYQLIILADNYKKSGRNIDVAAICIKEHGKVVHKYHVHDLPDIRLYYKGMFHRFHHGEDYQLMNRWIEGFLDMKDLLDINSSEKFHQKMSQRRHALIWYGSSYEKLDSRHQELMKVLYFKFSHDFNFFTTRSQELASEFGFRKDTLYEWNRYNNKFVEVPLDHIFDYPELPKKSVERVVHFIRSNSYQKITQWNPGWIKSHMRSSGLIFYIQKDHKLTPQELENSRIFNQTCIDLLYEKTHCLYYDHTENESYGMDGIYHLPLTHLSSTAVIFSRFHDYHREVFVLNLTDISLEGSDEQPTYLTLNEAILDDFFLNATSHPPKIKPFHLKMQELPENNHKRRIHVLNSESMYHFMRDHTHDLVVLYHNSTEESSRITMHRFVMAIKYVLRMSDKRPRIRFGTLDCERNDCYYAFQPANVMPVVVYYKAWEHMHPAFLDFNKFDSTRAIPVGEIVNLIHFEYTYTDREHLVHHRQFSSGQARHGPGKAYLHRYEEFKHYHDHSLEEHSMSGELHIDAITPRWPQNDDEEARIHHHDEVDFNFNFDLQPKPN